MRRIMLHGRVRLAVAVAIAAAAMFVTIAPGTARALPYERWSGSTRIATSVAVSQNGFPAGADTVFLATSVSFPDALAAGSVAGLMGAPILLTDPGALPELVRAELVRLAPSTVILLGGPGAISSAVETQVMDAIGVVPTRIAGVDRYDTAALVAAFGFQAAGTVYLATGEAYPDALSAGPAGGVNGGPVLLTRQSSLPGPTAQQISRLNNPRVVILGGLNAVSNAVLSQVDALTSGQVQRISGANRYTTGVALSQATFAAADTVVLATGLNFPDALSVAPVAAMRGAPIFLTQPACISSAVASEIQRLGASQVIVVGGPNAVSNNAAQQVVCQPPPPPPDPYTFRGTGPAVIPVTKPNANVPAIIEISITSTSNAIVWNLDAGLNPIDLLVNEIGNYSGTRLIDMPLFGTRDTTRYLDITATGAWTMRIRPLDAAPAFSTSTAGAGDRVLRYTGPARVMRLTHTGTSNFIVWHYRNYLSTTPDADLVVNEIGAYNATRAFPAGPAIVEVRADGNWTIGP